MTSCSQCVLHSFKRRLRLGSFNCSTGRVRRNGVSRALRHRSTAISYYFPSDFLLPLRRRLGYAARAHPDGRHKSQFGEMMLFADIVHQASILAGLPDLTSTQTSRQLLPVCDKLCLLKQTVLLVSEASQSDMLAYGRCAGRHLSLSSSFHRRITPPLRACIAGQTLFLGLQPVRRARLSVEAADGLRWRELGEFWCDFRLDIGLVVISTHGTKDQAFNRIQALPAPQFSSY